MSKIRLNNDTEQLLAVWVEPLGEDYWMRPDEQFTLTALDAGSGDPDEVPFDVVVHDQGISVWVNVGFQAVVRDRSGTPVDCGHQRPVEVLRKWTRAAEEAARGTTDSPAARESAREYAEQMRRALARAEADAGGTEREQ
ncbi:hypothetical protein [Streptomyces sp. SID5785]|uniref:hypothetical protein n=1 Tax=Streptomyces sp. SID5785 TaxID=2690309 RepID=UPI00192675A7|nr:hypothetical protein [Streptomyces sp. SID5785]